jgi:hypothetical protein
MPDIRGDTINSRNPVIAIRLEKSTDGYGKVGRNVKEYTLIDTQVDAAQGLLEKCIDAPAAQNASPVVEAERSARVGHRVAHRPGPIQAPGKKLNVHARRKVHSFAPAEGRSGLAKIHKNRGQHVGMMGGEWAIARPGVRALGRNSSTKERTSCRNDAGKASQAITSLFPQISKESWTANLASKFPGLVEVHQIKDARKPFPSSRTKSPRKLDIAIRSSVTAVSVAPTRARRVDNSKLSDQRIDRFPRHASEVKPANYLASWAAASSGLGRGFSEPESLTAKTALPNNLLRELDEYFMRQARLPPSGATAFDPRVTPAWAGLKIPM